MATSEIRTKMSAEAQFTITIGTGAAGLASGSARQSTLVSNTNNAPAAMLSGKITAGAAGPTVGTVYEFYLIRDLGTYATDGAGASDAAITIQNAPLIGTLVVTASANAIYPFADFDTAPLGPLGPTWGVAIKNSTGQATSIVAAESVIYYSYYVPEAQ